MEVKVLSYNSLKSLSVQEKINKILKIVKKGTIVMLEGRLTPQEETTLMYNALENVSGKFSGVEIAFLDSKTTQNFVEKVKSIFARLLLGERIGITVIGPSKIIKKIKMDPNQLEILSK